MTLKYNLDSFTSVFTFLLALLILIPVIPAWGEDSVDSSTSGLSARERFYQKYKDRIRNSEADSGSGEVAPPSREPRNLEGKFDELRKKREERRKARDLRREERRKKIGAENDRLEGKSANVSKKEKERLDARRKEMQERKAARIAEQRKKIEARRQAMKAKALKHKQEMQDKVRLDPGAAGYDDAVDDGKERVDLGKQKPPAVMNRMEELKKRREAMQEKARKHREAMRAKRKAHRANPDSGASRLDDVNPHVSGSASPGAGETAQPDAHISGSSSGGDRPHISGAR
ncbi:MAG: hypothetical protein G3M70_09000 [Candidatus Nitronauta litoralis]|uniref:Uncharacterized protein n=1 Tax=Candidatus Nitronauta litoralis TaxID=2705533 RepID=A0A7T0BW65_9BACT|nr:MAG: hypothetical protein G3M70_09000 [Candidatus Nitronauta litoralis]